MAISHAIVSVGTTATLLSATETDDRRGQSLLIQNPSTAVDVYIGGAGVTTLSYGHIIKASSATSGNPLNALAMDLDRGEAVYAVVAAGTQNVNVLRLGV